LERVTDQQYAVLDGHLRHLPGGIDEYLALAAARGPSTGSPSGGPAGSPASAASGTATSAGSAPKHAGLSGAALRAAEKEIAAIDRSLVKLADRIAAKHQELADHDQSDHVGLGRLTGELRALEDEVADAETRWLELSEQLG
jgi:hypothetical protein